MATTLNDLGQTLLAQLYEIVTGGDDTVPKATDNFISWCTPGIPFSPDDFQFSAQGLGSGATAEDEKKLLNQAYNFAQLIDFIPDPTGIYNHNRQETVYRTSEARLSHMYGEILKAAKVVHAELTDDQKAKLQKFRDLLTTTKTVTDIVTGDQKTVVDDSPMIKAYRQKESAYNTAVLNYNNKRIAAQTASGPDGKQAVLDWEANGTIYRQQVTDAENDWASDGYRNDVDEIRAYIDQVTGHSMEEWIQTLRQHYEDGLQSALGAGQTFYLTTLVPGDFATSDGWTGYGMTHDTVNTSTSRVSNSFGVSGGVNFGFWSVGVNASGQFDNYSQNSAISSFKLSFQLTPVTIVRAWCYPEFFMNRGWDLIPGQGWFFNDMPSDGQSPNGQNEPKGLYVGYATTALFARNIVITSSDFVSAYHSYSNSVGGGVSVGYGPFTLSGNYHHSDSGDSFSSDTTNESLTVPGMQIIGFVNHLIGKAPNLLPGINPADLV